MPEDEAKEGEQREAAAASPLGGMRGWIILIAAVLCEAIFFIVLMEYRKGAELKDRTSDEKIPRTPLDDVNKVKLHIRDLNFSIALQTNQVVTLAMEVVINLDYLDDELRNKKRISDYDWKKFEAALSKMEMKIRDMLQRYIVQQTHATLNSLSGREKIKEKVKEFVNDELSKIDLDLSEKGLTARRVSEVLIPVYYMQ